MYVRNVAGYNFAFKYNGAVIYIPFDGTIYSIPDDSGTYKELLVIAPMHIRTQKVVYINKDGSRASDKISGHKRRGRPPKPVVQEKPKEVEPKETPNTDKSVIEVNLDTGVNVTLIDAKEGPQGEKPIKEAVTPKEEEPPKKKRGRPRKTEEQKAKEAEEKAKAPAKKRGRPRKSTTSTKTSTPKKRGRPKKTTTKS